jgi:glycogen operon protein
VSFSRKHNETNGENNADGSDENASLNCGVEGASNDPDILAFRDRLKRNLMATLFLSLGVPMITAGDERGRTQRGNNNAYCQDNETSWLDWGPLTQEQESYHAFVKSLVRVRKAHPVFRRSAFHIGSNEADGGDHIVWIRPDGAEMTEDDWHNSECRVLGCILAQAEDSRFDCAILLNAGADPASFTLPDRFHGSWALLIDTSRPHIPIPAPPISAKAWLVRERSLVLLTREPRQ